MYSVYEIICLDRGSTPLTSTVLLPPARSIRGVSSMFRLHSGQSGHVVKLSNVDVPQDTDLFVNKRGQPRHVVNCLHGRVWF